MRAVIVDNCCDTPPLYILFEDNDGVLSVSSVISVVMIAFFNFLTCEMLTILIPPIVVVIIRSACIKAACC